MKNNTHGLKKTLMVLAAFIGTSALHATAILTVGNIPQTDENVLLNTGLSGNPIFGTTNQTGLSVRFSSSTAGEILSAPASGQARVVAVDGAFTNLTIDLPGATFTSLILNLDASANGFVDFTTTTNTGVETFDNFALSGSGENFFTFTTSHNQRYISISLQSDTPVNFVDAAQFRIGGAQRNIPDGGTTVAMLGMGLVGLFGLSRRFSA